MKYDEIHWRSWRQQLWLNLPNIGPWLHNFPGLVAHLRSLGVELYLYSNPED